MRLAIAVLAANCLALGMHARPEHWCIFGPAGVGVHLAICAAAAFVVWAEGR